MITHITEVERWQTAAGAIEAYRSRWNLDGTVAVGPEPVDFEQRAHWDRTVATVGAAGFFASGETHGAGTEREVLATRWENIHAFDRQRDDDRSIERSPVLSPEPSGQMSRISIGTSTTGSACEVESLPGDNTSII